MLQLCCLFLQLVGKVVTQTGFNGWKRLCKGLVLFQITDPFYSLSVVLNFKGLGASLISQNCVKIK